MVTVRSRIVGTDAIREPMTEGAGVSGARRWVILCVLCVTLLLISLDNTVLNVALPSIVRGLHATSTQLQWIVDSFAIFFAGLLLTFGALGDRMGRKWVFKGGLVVFGVGSALAAGLELRTDSSQQGDHGSGGGCLNAFHVVDPNQCVHCGSRPSPRYRDLGWNGWARSGHWADAGGFLLVHFWWGSVFLINVPVALIGLIATVLLIPNSKSAHARRFDPLGAALSIVGIGLLLWGIIEAPIRTWTSPLIVGPLTASVVIIALFVVWERNIDHPMLPLEIFANRRYSAAIASLALLLFALLGLFFLFTQYLQFSLGFSPLETGWAIAPIALVLLVAAPASVIFARRFGTKPVVATGLFLVAVGLGLFSRTTVHSTYMHAVPSIALIGLGVGFGLAPSINSIMGSLPISDAGVGSATSDTSMQLGGALGVAVLGTTLSIRYQNFMTPLLAHQQIPTSIDKLITGSLGSALAVSTHVHGKAGEALAEAARRGFVSGMDLGLVVATVVVAVAGLVALVALPTRPGESVSPRMFSRT